MKTKGLSVFSICLLLLIILPIAPAQSLEIMVGEPTVKRICGSNRFGTAVAVSKEGWVSSDTVVLARGDDYADALAGVPLAYALDAPMLLTHNDRLPESTKAEILRLKPTKAYILGGTSAVSLTVENALKAMGLNVVRIAGSNRYGTAAEVARELAKFNQPAKAILAYGQDFPDALAAASYAAVNGYPILLARADLLTSATAAVIEELNINDFVVVGGTSVISEALFNSLPSAERISGRNRYETAVELAKYFEPATDQVYLATGLDFADAITGGVLAAKTGNGMLLVQQYRIPQSVQDYLDSNAFANIVAFGGTGVLSDSTLSWAAGLEAQGNSAGNIVNDGRLVSLDGWVYFCDWYNLYRARTDGSYKELICGWPTTVRFYYLNVIGDWLYFAGLDYSGFEDNGNYIYRMRIDGTGLQKLAKGERLHVVDDLIYFTSSEDNNIYRMKNDGSQMERLLETEAGIDTLYVDNGYLYYAEILETGSRILMRMDTKTRNIETVSNSTYNVIVQGNWIYGIT